MRPLSPAGTSGTDARSSATIDRARSSRVRAPGPDDAVIERETSATKTTSDEVRAERSVVVVTAGWAIAIAEQEARDRRQRGGPSGAPPGDRLEAERLRHAALPPEREGDDGDRDEREEAREQAVRRQERDRGEHQ